MPVARGATILPRPRNFSLPYLVYFHSDDNHNKHSIHIDGVVYPPLDFNYNPPTQNEIDSSGVSDILPKGGAPEPPDNTLIHAAQVANTVEVEHLPVGGPGRSILGSDEDSIGWFRVTIIEACTSRVGIAEGKHSGG